jgi:hypothetical protein
MKRNSFVRCTQVLLMLGALAVTLVAQAATDKKGPCSPRNIARGSAGTEIDCAEGGIFHARSSCDGQSFSSETLRMWDSQAVTAFLSGKHLSITYDTASYCITMIELW